MHALPEITIERQPTSARRLARLTLVVVGLLGGLWLTVTITGRAERPQMFGLGMLTFFAAIFTGSLWLAAPIVRFDVWRQRRRAAPGTLFIGQAAPCAVDGYHGISQAQTALSLGRGHLSVSRRGLRFLPGHQGDSMTDLMWREITEVKLGPLPRSERLT